MQNARFWEFVNGGWVKLTLRPGQTLGWTHYEPTDEGWSRDSCAWTLEEEGVLRESESRGRDCDGLHGAYQQDFCALADLRAVAVLNYTWGSESYEREERAVLNEKGEPMFRACWGRHKPARCYDQFAQAAGY